MSIAVDHVTLYRWVQRFTPILATSAGPCQHAVSSRWFVEENYAKVSGSWRYVNRALHTHRRPWRQNSARSPARYR